MTLIPLFKLVLAVGFLLMPVFLIAFRNSKAMPEFLRAPDHWGVKIVFLMIATVICIALAAVTFVSMLPPPAVMN